MQAVIMAGGEGSRLRPLTCNMPKPLAKLCGKCVVDYITDLLRLHGCDKAVLTVMYKGEMIQAHFTEQPVGIELLFSYEDTPLGTAGSVKKAYQMLDNAPFLVISGDAMCDFDLTSAIAFHQAKEADATIVVKHVSDPREYGLISTSEDGRITGFIEKPSYASAASDIANTGIYILSPSVMELIEEGKQTDFAQNVFPEMLRRGMKLFSYEENGYWCDIGDIRSYVRCQQDILDGKVNCQLDGHTDLEGNVIRSRLPDTVKLSPPVYVGENCRIGAYTVLESGTVLGDNVTVGERSKLHASVALNNVTIGNQCSLSSAVLCEGVRTGNQCGVYEGAVVGEGCTMGSRATIQPGVRIWPRKKIEDDTLVTYDVKYGYARDLTFDDDGLCGTTNADITPEVCAQIGNAVATLAKGTPVAVGCSECEAGKSLAFAVISGIMCAGSDVWDFRTLSGAEFDFCCNKSGAYFGIYVQSGLHTTITVSELHGLPLTRAQERRLESYLNRGEGKHCLWDDFGRHIDLSGMRKLYEDALRRLAPQGLEGVRAQIRSQNQTIQQALSNLTTDMGVKASDDLILYISADGKRLTAYTVESGFISHERLLLILCRDAFQAGNDVALPYSFSKSADALAQQYGRQVHRYYSCTCDDSDLLARQLACSQSYLRDGSMMAVQLLRILKESGNTLEQSLSGIPQLNVAGRFVVSESPVSGILSSLAGKNISVQDGVWLKEDGSDIYIKPMKNGKGLLLQIQSAKAEIADELCDVYEQRIKDGNHQP